MLEILDEKQSPVFLDCLQATITKYMEKIVGKCDDVSLILSLTFGGIRCDIAFDGG
jgi:dTDP-4-amino-4,6-dideoxygalactose transaminase